ncbi:dual specificity protein phosphatase family protein [Psychromonas sp. MME2]|uniref:phosphatase domain-containing putative toxin n=1 Tax=unclassified Psychromonas TaxID=2614957 RepID=UPI00339D0DB0
MTSIHPCFPLPIENSAAELLLMPCPGTKGVPLQETLKQLKTKEKVDALITLMTSEELLKNQLVELGGSVKELGISWFHLPITDDHAPSDDFLTLWETAGPAIHRLLEQGKRVAIHCKGGTGRTGLVAAQILVERGENLEKVMTRIKKRRPNAFTLTCHQDYLKSLAEKLQ